VLHDWLRGHLPPSLKRLLKAVRAQARRPLSLHPLDGGVTQFVLDKHCHGRGAEIGPGLDPYGPRDRTVMVERFATRRGHPTVADVYGDGAALPLAPASMDFLISSHMLEHHPDPLAVLKEWRRVLRTGGRLVLILPHVDRTYDRGRTLSTVAHLEAVHGLPHDDVSPLNWDEFERFSLPSQAASKPTEAVASRGWCNSDTGRGSCWGC
jgi:SAM-dependent methyltransferase